MTQLALVLRQIVVVGGDAGVGAQQVFVDLRGDDADQAQVGAEAGLGNRVEPLTEPEHPCADAGQRAGRERGAQQLPSALQSVLQPVLHGVPAGPEASLDPLCPVSVPRKLTMLWASSRLSSSPS